MADVLILTVEHQLYKEVFEKLREIAKQENTWTDKDERLYQESLSLWETLHPAHDSAK